MMHFGRAIRWVAVVGVLLVAGAAPAAAAVWRVDAASGSDTGGCGSEASPCATIQQAVNQAASNDTVLVAQGTYVDVEACVDATAVVCVQKPLTILGGFAGGNWSLPDPVAHPTVIDGQNARRGLRVRSVALRMEGFTIRNCRAAATTSHAVGGGMWATFADVTLRDMVFEGNVAVGGSSGQGIGGGAAILSNAGSETTVVLERVTFRTNQATGGVGTDVGVVEGVGGGLTVNHTTLTALDVIFEGNAAVGGGVSTTGQAGLGGGAAFMFGTDAVLQRLRATGNSATGAAGSTTGGHAYGGAVYSEGADAPAAEVTTVTILDSYFSGNASTGGASPVAPGFGVGGAMAIFASRLTLERSTVVGNQTDGGAGGTNPGAGGGAGVFLEWPFSSATQPMNVIRNTIVADNVTEGFQVGGTGIRLLGAAGTVEHCTLVDNRLIGAGFGSGILVQPRLTVPSALTLSYSVLADHTVATTARALHVQVINGVGSSVDVSKRNLFVGNSHDTNFNETNSGTYVGYPGTNLFDPNPSTFFVSPAAGDYHVDGTVPPTNSATGSTEALDVDGAARSGTRDLGADEFGALAFALSVGKIGVGSGTVTSSPSGINCGVDCFEIYGNGTSVTLTPTADPGFYFTGWDGDADCTDGVVLMNADRSCTAQFEDQESPPPQCTVQNDTLTLTGSESGSPTWQACVSISAESYTVTTTGDVRLEAPLIILRNGFRVQPGGSFSAASILP